MNKIEAGKMHQPWLSLAFLLLLPSLISSLSSAVANLSSSWVNEEYKFGGYYVYSNDYDLQHILYRESFQGPSFLCGFCCLKNEGESCFFGVLIYTWSENNFTESPALIWSANRNHPVRLNATLNFTQSGNLVLTDVDGTLVWSTSNHSKGKSALGMNLTESGNLVIYGENSSIVWQSFDHPTDCLLPGQRLVPGQKLTSNISSSDLTEGLFSISFTGDTLVAYMHTSPRLSYFEFESAINFEVANGSFYYIYYMPYTQFARIENDGHLRVYVWQQTEWMVLEDVFTLDIRECGYPLVCGKYGTCSKGQCGCPEGFTTFKQIKNERPNLGCEPVIPISCNHSEFHTLVELKGFTYFSLNQMHPFLTREYYTDTATLEDCKTICLKNCSCKAALYVKGYSGEYSSLGCILLSEVYSLMDGGKDGVRVLIKVEKSSIAPYPSRHLRIILGLSLGALFGALFLVCSCYIFYKRFKEHETNDELYVDQATGMLTRFSLEYLKVATRNFTTKLGEGGFGSVFEGVMSNEVKVAVKRLDGLEHIKKSFLAEVETIGSIHHVNLVRLIGFCFEKSHRLLVYEYMPNGSLDKWIFRNSQVFTLGWQSRRKIIMDIAKGLAYLHEDCRKKIFHLDIKPQNILLDEDFTAKVADFGLAKLIEKDQSRIKTTLRGTPGYLAPEWLSSVITEKVDVYSFGVVVLEILCGRKNLDRSQPEDDMHLLSLFERKAKEGQLLDIVDRSSEDMQLYGEEVVEMMKIVVWCLQNDYSKRPSMSTIVKVLEGSVIVANDLDYNISNFAVPRTSVPVGQAEDVLGDPTLLLPSILSGPR